MQEYGIILAARAIQVNPQVFLGDREGMERGW
jgi:hypothetical protein